jgi:60 kDa SS-A/Ro ribonucleoprotein
VTWEDVTSKFGSSPEVWAWAAEQMPYMALLRNLRNLSDAGVPSNVMLPVLARISSLAEVSKSKQLPFRFLSAARVFGETGGRAAKEVKQAKASPYTQAVLDALDTAARLSCSNLGKLPGVTALFVDDSSSMNDPISSDSSVSCVDAAAMLATIIAFASEDVRVFAFSTDVRIAPFRRADSMLTNMGRMVSAHGGNTNAYLCPKALAACGVVPARVVLLSDMQCWDDTGARASLRDQWIAYRRDRAIPFYSINVKGTVEAQMASSDRDVHLLSGFSEKLVTVIAGTEAPGEDGAPRSATPTLEVIRKEWYLA